MNTVQQGSRRAVIYLAHFSSASSNTCYYRCSTGLLIFGIFLSIVGGIMTGTSYRKPSPPFDKPFFTKGDKANPLRIVGPILLGVGLFLLISSIISCCVLKIISHGQQDQRQQNNRQICTEAPIQPSYIYPQQLQAQYPPTSFFNYQQNSSAAYNTYFQNNVVPPPLYDSQHGVQSYNSTNDLLNNPCGNDNFASVTPSAPPSSICGVTPHYDAQRK